MTTAELSVLYRRHLHALDGILAEALSLCAEDGPAFEGVLFHSGHERYYHRDDHPIAFHPSFHYRRWIPPQGGPDHVVLARPGRKPAVARVLPRDYWFDTTPPAPSHWESEVELRDVESFDDVADALGLADAGRLAYLGPDADAAAKLGCGTDAVEPDGLMTPLDWFRAAKTDYEIALTRVACANAARGHLRAREVFFDGGSEAAVHRAYLEAADALEGEMPYGTIVAFDHKSATLHYQHKRGSAAAPGTTCLVDAGADHCGYAADITRTWARDDAHPVFRELIRRVDATERHLVAMVAPGRSYVDLHLEAHRHVGAMLSELGILKVSGEEAVERRFTRVFLPHGVGHGLGLQVHEVGGHQATVRGGTNPPPDDHVLRNTRTLEPGHLVTVEPGVYFVPMLLEPLRSGEDASCFDWDLVDALVPCGGIRIEDDVVCTADGFEDLTRDSIEGVLDGG